MKKGDLLARLGSDDYRQQVEVDEATMRVRDSQLAPIGDEPPKSPSQDSELIAGREEKGRPV